MKFNKAFLLLIFLIAGCTPQNVLEEQEKYLGFSFSPRSSQIGHFNDFFQKADSGGNAVTWAGDWFELGDQSKAPYSIAKAARLNNLEPIIIVNFYQQDLQNFKLLRPFSKENKNLYLEYTKKYIEMMQPRFFGIGIEINILQEKDAEAYKEFVEFFKEVTSTINEASPQTKIFTVFQLERIKGMHGGLFGGENDPKNKSNWQLLADFPDADFLAFTSYPFLIYKDSKDIPHNYYSEIRSYTDKPIIFTELGWDRKGFPDWESSSLEQARYIDRFFDLTKSLNPKIVIWSFLYDQKIPAPFAKNGLLRDNAETSPAWTEWIQHL